MFAKGASSGVMACARWGHGFRLSDRAPNTERLFWLVVSARYSSKRSLTALLFALPARCGPESAFGDVAPEAQSLNTRSAQSSSMVSFTPQPTAIATERTASSLSSIGSRRESGKAITALSVWLNIRTRAVKNPSSSKPHPAENRAASRTLTILRRPRAVRSLCVSPRWPSWPSQPIPLGSD
jgi:hypothetical protein